MVISRESPYLTNLLLMGMLGNIDDLLFLPLPLDERPPALESIGLLGFGVIEYSDLLQHIQDILVSPADIIEEWGFLLMGVVLGYDGLKKTGYILYIIRFLRNDMKLYCDSSRDHPIEEIDLPLSRANSILNRRGDVPQEFLFLGGEGLGVMMGIDISSVLGSILIMLRSAGAFYRATMELTSPLPSMIGPGSGGGVAITSEQCKSPTILILDILRFLGVTADPAEVIIVSWVDSWDEVRLHPNKLIFLLERFYVLIIGF